MPKHVVEVTYKLIVDAKDTEDALIIATNMTPTKLDLIRAKTNDKGAEQ